jgi:hypothetical protein
MSASHQHTTSSSKMKSLHLLSILSSIVYCGAKHGSNSGLGKDVFLHCKKSDSWSHETAVGGEHRSLKGKGKGKGNDDGSLTVSRRGSSIDVEERNLWNKTVVALSFSGELTSNLQIGYSQGDQPDLSTYTMRQEDPTNGIRKFLLQSHSQPLC